MQSFLNQMLPTLLGICFVWLSNSPALSEVNWNNHSLYDIHHRTKVITAVDIISSHNYPVETHTVVTRDGYILSVFRIPSSQLCGSNGPKPVVLINHGMTGSADSWLLTGPRNGLPFLLADACYDVWLINCRGTRYSRKHLKLKAWLLQFWRFSWHEIGMEDLPATVDHILATTKQKSLHYVGHSQGCTSVLVMLSMRPEYNKRIRTTILLAPPAFLRHSLSMGHKIMKPLFSLLPDIELLPHHKLLNSAVSAICKILGVRDVCTALYLLTNGRVSQHMNRTLIPMLIATHPAGISTRQPRHFFQLKDSGRFRQYDFGFGMNYLIYRQNTPPDYPLHLVRPHSAIHIFYSDDDGTISPRDVLALASKLPYAVPHHITDETWNHMDFLLANNLNELINNPAIQIIETYEEDLKQKIGNIKGDISVDALLNEF
ncbi:lipase 3 [Drosophila mauritiana]|uniref:Lipase n=1 Tax=Drosophila mauritiana TaxID=7226 RepID=A0A6P8KTT4_DROMA|nr:lipase 3 [Drosophila mauritiana]